MPKTLKNNRRPSSIAASSKAARPKAATPTAAAAIPKPVLFTALIGFALVAAFIVYAPSMNGAFVFDDRNQTFLRPGAETFPLRSWLHVRPLLMLTYYLNLHLGGLDVFPYHVVNVVGHAFCSVLVFFVVRRVLALAQVPENRRSILSLFCAGVFLLHPLQTEAVSYISSRSEVMSVLFFLGAWLVFLARRDSAISIRTTILVLLLYGCAMASKEHTVVLPAVLLLTDYFWNPGFSFSGIRRNWKLYVPTAVAGVAGALFILRYIGGGSNIGFNLKDLTWSQYLFTQFRAFFLYLRLFLFPYGQSADWNFPVSHTIFEHGAIFYGVALLIMIAAAIGFRRKFPLASFGFFVALILFAPTSSIIPIHDTVAERRMYLPFIGLLFIGCEGLSRLPLKRQTMVAVLTGLCLVYGSLSFARNRVWVNMETLWRDVVAKDSGNTRALMGLGSAYALEGKCAEAIPYLEVAASRTNAYQDLFNLAGAQECANRLDAAFATYSRALTVRQTAEAWAQIGFIRMKRGQAPEALDSLDRATAIDGLNVLANDYRGVIYLAMNRFDDAAAQFQRALSVDPSNEMALRGLDRARHHVSTY